jgi:ketosteroid isomerase-like protein
MPASGRPFRFPIVFVLDVRDGLIVHDRRIYDFTGLLVQIGMIKAKPRDH